MNLYQRLLNETTDEKEQDPIVKVAHHSTCRGIIVW